MTLDDILLGILAAISAGTLTAFGVLAEGWWRARPRPATLGSSVSEVAVEGVLHIDGENAQPEGVGHFAEQHHRSSWIAMSGVERMAHVLSDYGPRLGVFRRSRKPLHGPSAWNTAPSRTARSIAAGEGG